MGTPIDPDWRRILSDPRFFEGRVGQGPARAACLDVIAAFKAGMASVDWPDGEGIARAFAVEGQAFARTLEGAPLQGPPSPWALFALVGAGIACPLLPPAPAGREQSEGWGFGAAMLRPGAALRRGARPDQAVAEAFDHGLGRALWFQGAGHPERLRRAVSAFPAARRPALWTGVGTACAFAGGGIASHGLFAAADTLAPHLERGLAQGAALRATVHGCKESAEEIS